MTKQKKKSLQGMEHLQRDITASKSVSSTEDGGTTHAVLKKELFMVTGIMFVLFAVLVGLTVYDNNSSVITEFASTLTATFTN